MNETPQTFPEQDAPRALALELTKGCNLRCPYCYYADREDAYDAKRRMSDEVARRSVDMVLERESKEPAHIHFFGGEPLLSPELLKRTVLYGEWRAAELGKEITFEVTTNGTRFDQSIIAFLNDHHIRVGVSFDGPQDIQDRARPAFSGSSYARAEPGIRRFLLSREGTDLEDSTHVSVVVTRRDMDLLRITDHLESMGFKKILLTPATDLEGRGEGIRTEDLDELLHQYDRLAENYEQRRERGEKVPSAWFPLLMNRWVSQEKRTTFCGGGRDYLGVDAEGDLGLCYRFFERDDFAMGNVFDGVDRAVTRRLESHDLDSRTDCSKCWARYFCGGGCHHDNVVAGQGLDRANPITCDIFRHSMSRTIEMWARLSSKGVLPRDLERPRCPEDKMTQAASNQNHQTCPTRRESCYSRDLGDERVVYDPQSHNVAVLNPTASFIFELCDGSRSQDQILDELRRAYDAPRDVLREDLERTLASLREKSLVS